MRTLFILPTSSPVFCYGSAIYDETGEVSWFDVHNPRLMHHRFDKVKE